MELHGDLLRQMERFEVKLLNSFWFSMDRVAICSWKYYSTGEVDVEFGGFKASMVGVTFMTR